MEAVCGALAELLDRVSGWRAYRCGRASGYRCGRASGYAGYACCRRRPHVHASGLFDPHDAAVMPDEPVVDVAMLVDRVVLHHLHGALDVPSLARVVRLRQVVPGGGRACEGEQREDCEASC